MVSLILYSLLTMSSMTLSFPSYTTPPTNQQVNVNVSYLYAQDNSIVAYHYVDNVHPLRSYNRYDMSFSGGQVFSFDIEVDSGVSGSQDYWSLKFKVWQQSYMTNLFLSNIKVTLDGDSDTDYFYLPNVYFLGQNTYYEDDESGNYTLFWDTQEQALLYISFDMSLMDYRLVDGSQYQNGYTEGWNAGNDNGFSDGYSNGYTDGYNDAVVNLDTQGSTALTIFTGIIDVGLLPINVFLAMMNFEVFGINIGGLISSLMTVAIAIIIFRVIFNGGSGGGGKS